MGTSTVLCVALVAILFPLVYRLVASPVALIILSPLIILFVLLTFLLLYTLLGHILDYRRPHRAQSLSRSAKPFTFSTPAAWQAVLTRSQWSKDLQPSLPPLVPELPIVSRTINDILSLIIRDFVLTWYKELSASPEFPLAVSSLVHNCLERLLDRASDIDLPTLIVKRILPKVTMHIDLFRKSEVALRGAALERRLTQSEELDILLASRYAAGRDDGKLHPAIENLSTTFTKQTEEMHLRKLIDIALPLILPETEAQSKAIRIVAREIVACAILYPVMEMLSDPDFWNRAMDQVAGAAIHQQKLVTKVRNVLEAQSPRNDQSLASPPVTAETITIHTDVRHFESFLRSINRCSSLLDARRLKNDIVGEIRRTRILLANHEKDDWINGEKTEDVVAFLDRLYTAKKKVEQRIVVLGGEDDSRLSAYPETANKSGLKLRDILSNPGSLSYFMEFVDRRQRSLLVQFWLTVESFKNPLESVDSDSEHDDDDAIQDPSTAATVKEDIAMIHDLYFSSHSPHPLLSSIPKKYVDAIRDFARTDSATPTSQAKVRRSVMLAQRQIERDMEHDFEEFQRSELWFRVIGDTDVALRKSDKTLSKDTAPPSSLTPPPLPKAAPPPLPHFESSPALIQRTSSTSKVPVATNPPPRPTPSNIEVLMSPVSDASSDSHRAPLFDDPDDELQRAEEKRMQAIQAALTDIIALDSDQQEKGSIQESNPDISRRHRKSQSVGRKRRPVFEDDFEDEIEDLDEEANEPETKSSFELPAPGDLQLSREISRLGEKIVNLQAQERMLDSLISKAELTGDTQELKLLSKSKSSMSREIRELRFQKSQYEQQESANRLFSDRTRVSIVSSAVADEDGKSVVRYLVEVQQLGPDGTFASGWVIARRYNEFLNMHNRLRDKYAQVRQLDFPGKRLVTALSGNLVDTRKAALEKYMQGAIAIPLVCDSEELRAFLSRDSPLSAAEQKSSSKGQSFSGTKLVRNVYRSVTESIDDIFFGQSMMDVMIQRLTRQVAEFAGLVGSAVNDEELVAQALSASGKSPSEAALMLSPDLKPLEGESTTSTFSAPICDLVLAVFELNNENSWLRRQAIVIILQQVLGGTIERKMRETVKAVFEEMRLMSFINIFREGLWPGGKLKPPSVPRTAEEKAKTRDDANRKLSSLIPDLAANMIGRSNARRGARRIFAVVQNRRLNQHIVYAIVDEVFAALFPEASANR